MYTGVIIVQVAGAENVHRYNLLELPEAKNTYWSNYSKDSRSRECLRV